MMTLEVVTPTGVFTEGNVLKITAKGGRGFFCLLPRHIDFVETLVPGLLSYTTSGGKEIYMAVDEGVLVKKNDKVSLSVRAAIKGGEPGTLKKIVREQLETIDEQEKKSRQVLAKLEADFARRFLEIK